MTTCVHVCPGIICTFIGERLSMKKLQDDMEDDSGTESDDSHAISSGIYLRVTCSLVPKLMLE